MHNGRNDGQVRLWVTLKGGVTAMQLERGTVGSSRFGITKDDPFKYFRTNRADRMALVFEVHLPSSPRRVEDHLRERGSEVSHESIGFRWKRLGQMFAWDTREKRSGTLGSAPQWQLHPDKVVVKMYGVRQYSNSVLE